MVIIYHVDDETTAQRIKSTLSQYNLEVELLSPLRFDEYIKKSNEMAEQTDTHFLQLWTRSTAMDLWDPLQLADAQQPQQQHRVSCLSFAPHRYSRPLAVDPL